jgi:DNA-binding LacI/PurR family transcriptional regulator
MAADTQMTLQEIAKRARVSIATVSRIINRVPTVNPALARRVWRVIEQVGYYPNIHARALVSGRSRIFGVMVSEIINPFFPEIVQRFMELGVEHNYEILLSSLGQDLRLMEIAGRQMIERRVDGVAILTFGGEDSLIEMFTRRNVPVFVVDIDSPEPLLKTVQIDYQHGIRQAVQHLAALGHVRIAFVTGPTHLKTAVLRKIAFQECMKEIGLEIPPQLLVGGDHTMAAGMKAMSALSALPDRPSAVVCSNDMTAIGVMREAFELAIDIPRALSVVGFDDIRLAEFMIPPLTTVQMSQMEIADMAFRALLESVEPQRSEPSCQVYAIKTNLVLRRSTTLAPGRVRDSAVGKRGDEQAGAERTRERSEGQSVLA